MKKSEFLEAVKGREIVFGWKPCFDPREKGQRTVEGLPESVQGVHVNQAFAWLSEERRTHTMPHPDWTSTWGAYDRAMCYEDATGWYTPDADEYREWLDWYDRHPYTVFRC